MRLFITGACGQLGYEVINEAVKHGHEVIASDVIEEARFDVPFVALDITNAEAVMDVITASEVEAVIHCAAWTAVEEAEDPKAYDMVYDINVKGTMHIATACKTTGAKLIYISTDYVYDGTGAEPYQADDERFNPLNIYGKSKLEGELIVRRLLERYFIVRTAWLFGGNGKNFVTTMLDVGTRNNDVRVVNDQIGSPTYSVDLARLLIEMVETEKYGCYHATNTGGYISWYDFCCEIFRQAGINTEVVSVTTAEYGMNKAIRPLNSRLETYKLIESGFNALPDWHDALKRFLEQIGKRER